MVKRCCKKVDIMNRKWLTALELILCQGRLFVVVQTDIVTYMLTLTRRLSSEKRLPPLTYTSAYRYHKPLSLPDVSSEKRDPAT